MPKVYVIQEPSPRALTGWVPDIRPAEKHGEIVYIFKADEKPHAMSRKDVEDRIFDFLDYYNPEHDSILWCGGDLISLIMVSAFMAGEYREMHQLQWQRMPQGGFYSRMHIDFSNLMRGE